MQTVCVVYWSHTQNNALPLEVAGERDIWRAVYVVQLVRWLVSGLISSAGAGLLWEENTVGWLISPGWNQQANMLKIVKIHKSTTDINMYVYYIKSTTDINTSWWSLHFCLLVTCYSVILRENPTRCFTGPVRLNLSAIIQYFSLTINQRTVLFSLAFQRNEQGHSSLLLAALNFFETLVGWLHILIA